mgnify:CR=1 FL=1
MSSPPARLLVKSNSGFWKISTRPESLSTASLSVPSSSLLKSAMSIIPFKSLASASLPMMILMPSPMFFLVFQRRNIVKTTAFRHFNVPVIVALEAVGHILYKQQRQNIILITSRFHTAPQFITRSPISGCKFRSFLIAIGTSPFSFLNSCQVPIYSSGGTGDVHHFQGDHFAVFDTELVVIFQDQIHKFCAVNAANNRGVIQVFLRIFWYSWIVSQTGHNLLHA